MSDKKGLKYLGGKALDDLTPEQLRSVGIISYSPEWVLETNFSHSTPELWKKFTKEEILEAVDKGYRRMCDECGMIRYTNEDHEKLCDYINRELPKGDNNE